jgi:uncharacterized protein YkwD
VDDAVTASGEQSPRDVAWTGPQGAGRTRGPPRELLALQSYRTTRMSTAVAMTAVTALFTAAGFAPTVAQAQQPPQVMVQQPVQQPVQVAAPQPTNYVVQQPAAAQPAGDPYGFTSWLNSVRAQYGLPAVGFDPNLANWAAVNNNQQLARGMGHFVMGPARRQNCAMGSYSSIFGMWMASPAHRAALLDPSIRWIGLAGAGAYWTFNAY